MHSGKFDTQWPICTQKQTIYLLYIETVKFKAMVDAMGTDTVRSLASGPQDHQVKMLKALGLQSTLITDGRNPINLFSTAQGLLGQMTDQSQ